MRPERVTNATVLVEHSSLRQLVDREESWNTPLKDLSWRQSFIVILKTCAAGR